ncbi:SHS2 domain-containing protein [Halopolyspora algeriensis]|uniref:SHS2 domain-containing protein n=1 Tax=Halopolyspora algeriensis TaxID=1500506 RepID=A0A368VV09_9ACTN|nr:archease [Halopolyspora algeriensis]RCW44498.1 SHS2 domain-containing protein [Halopolyspora algeriensis]TQM55859.1 SHS2 domain-containing protein [Halopolyspora algeriensis]
MSHSPDPEHRRRGHRNVPHTADVRLEAWAPHREDCLVEAVAGLVESFAEPPPEGSWTVTVDFPSGDDEATLVSVLDTVIHLMETRDGLPVRAGAESCDGGVRMRFHLADLRQVDITGAVPKAVTWHELRFRRHETGWSCAATIDV